MKNLLLVVVLLLLSGCGTHIGKMEYAKGLVPSIEKASAEKTVYVETFKDSRSGGGGKDSVRIGKIVGGFGEPLRSIEVDKPVGQSTSDVMCNFLNGAGVKAVKKPESGIIPQDGFTLSGDITAYHCAFYYAHNANIVIDLVLIDNATGRPIWKSAIDNHYSGGNMFTKYTAVRNDPSINCLGFDCHARGISAAMNIMLSEGIVDAWERDGLREAISGEQMADKSQVNRLSSPAVSMLEMNKPEPMVDGKPRSSKQ